MLMRSACTGAELSQSWNAESIDAQKQLGWARLLGEETLDQSGAIGGGDGH